MATPENRTCVKVPIGYSILAVTDAVAPEPTSANGELLLVRQFGTMIWSEVMASRE